MMCAWCYDGTPGIIACEACNDSVCKAHLESIEPKTLCLGCFQDRARLQANVEGDTGGTYLFLARFGGFLKGFRELSDDEKVGTTTFSRN